MYLEISRTLQTSLELETCDSLGAVTLLHSETSFINHSSTELYLIAFTSFIKQVSSVIENAK